MYNSPLLFPRKQSRDKKVSNCRTLRQSNRSPKLYAGGSRVSVTKKSFPWPQLWKIYLQQSYPAFLGSTWWSLKYFWSTTNIFPNDLSSLSFLVLPNMYVHLGEGKIPRSPFGNKIQRERRNEEMSNLIFVLSRGEIEQKENWKETKKNSTIRIREIGIGRHTLSCSLAHGLHPPPSCIQGLASVSESPGKKTPSFPCFSLCPVVSRRRTERTEHTSHTFRAAGDGRGTEKRQGANGAPQSLYWVIIPCCLLGPIVVHLLRTRGHW